ncbi:MAG: hypothetical protein LJE59_14115 [Chromatiaceae bacterium]|jgi:hypothetical protein|nr:hypothetical protein [Chromatiaceae bacterium]
MSLPERRRHPRWRTEGARAFLYARGEPVQRCKVRCVSKAGLFIETDQALPEGLMVELALTQAYTRQLVKIVRRSAYVARASSSGVAILFFVNRKVVT